MPQSILRAALIRRAVEDIQRIIQIRSAKQACTTLLQKGSVGDDLFQRFTRAENEMEAELRDVVMEVCSATDSCRVASFRDMLGGCANTDSTRPTDLRPTGVKPFSNLPTRSTRILRFSADSKRSSPRPMQRRSGGRSAAQPSPKAS